MYQEISGRHPCGGFTRKSLRQAASLILLAAVLGGPILGSPTFAAESEKTSLSLNGEWRFAYAGNEAEAEALSGFYDPQYTSSAFKPTPVPSNWAVLGYEEPAYKKLKADAGEGFYLRSFTPPADWKDNRVLLHFDGVWSSAEVWLNGKLLGRYDSGFTRFSFDITRYLKAGKENVLAVRVRQLTREYEFDTNDDWTLGGIYRDVTLEAMPKNRWMDPLRLQTTFDNDFRDGELNVRVMVGDTNKRLVPGNYVGPGEPYDLRFTLLDAAGKTVQSRTVPVPAHYGTGRETQVALKVADVLRWTAETPDLYTLRVDLLEKGSVTQTRSERVGFREISTKGGVFRVNGQAVKLRGVNRHEEHPDVGRATTRAQWIEDIRLMKAANINFIRLAHYPPAKGFLELCDEMGMYVGDEIAMGYGGALLYDPSYVSAIMVRTHDTVERDINHPSVIFWAVGNEDPLTSLHMSSIRTAKGLDPTRPVLLPWRADLWLPPEVDILAPHYLTAQDNDELAAVSTRPIITTEYSHAYGNDGMGGLDDRWKALVKHPTGAGGAIWMWADQGLKYPIRQPDGSTKTELKLTQDGWDGIVDSYRHPTRDYWEARAVYAPVYPAISQATFVPGQASVRIPIQNDYDFTDLKAVKIDWVIMADETPLASGVADLSGKPHAATPYELPLEAVRRLTPDKTYYVWFTVKNAAGEEISRRTVELVNQTHQTLPPRYAGKPVVQTGSGVTVTVGRVSYRFDPQTAQVTEVSVEGKKLLTDLRPTIWRKLNDSETIQLKKGEAEGPDLNAYTVSALKWQVHEAGDVVTIEASADYRVDAHNRFGVVYNYTIGPDGALGVKYEVTPEIQAAWVPHIGMQATTDTRLTQLRWLGLGPYDANPNMQVAPILGAWSGLKGSEAVVGTKAIRWVELSGAEASLRILSDGYLRTQAQAPDQVQILSHLVGKGSKDRQPEDPHIQLNTDKGQTYVGAFTLRPPAE